MTGSSTDSNSLSALARVGLAHSPKPSAIEEEVVELFDLLRDSLLHYVMSFSLSVSDSEDVLQETFLALFEHLRRGKSRENLRAWLFRVAHNLALKRQRSQRTCKSVPDPLVFTDSSVVCPAPNPEDQYMDSQRQKRVAAVLHALPERNRRCLNLRAEGLRYRDIADVLNISLASVSTCLARSLALIARAANR